MINNTIVHKKASSGKVAHGNHRDNHQDLLGLDKDPFQPEPDLLLYHAFESFEQRLNILKRLAQSTDAIVLVVGESGSGKTTLLYRFLSLYEAFWKAGKIQTDSSRTPIKSTPPENQSGLPAIVLQDSEDPMVIIDEAHRLSSKDLRTLLQDAVVPGSARNIKRLMLFGDPSVHSSIAGLGASIEEIAVNRIHLPPLTKDETNTYLNHRLANAGYTGKSPFSESDIEKIYETSRGLPGRINKRAKEILNEAYPHQIEKEVNVEKVKSSPRRFVGWIVAGICLIGLAFLLFTQFGSGPESESRDQESAKRVFSAKIPSTDEPKRSNVFVAKVPKSAAEPPTPIEKVPQPAEKPQPLKEEESHQQPIVSKIEEPTEPEKATTLPTEIKPIEEAPLEKMPAVAEKEDVTQPEMESPKIKPLAKTPAIAEKKEEEKKMIHRESWLLAQDSSFYTLQIIGVRNEQSLLDFVKKYNLLEANDIAYYQTKLRGKIWFPLLYGVYPTKKEAQLAVRDLPEKIQKTIPWSRKMSVVQREIRR